MSRDQFTPSVSRVEPGRQDTEDSSSKMLNLNFVSSRLRERSNVKTEEDFAGEKSESRSIARKKSRRSANKNEPIIVNKPPLLRIISLDEVAWHDDANDCWIAIYDYVYDCTEFINNHPGGSDIIMEYAGRDATLAFIGTGHSAHATEILKKYLIGELPLEEQLFRKANGIKITEAR